MNCNLCFVPKEEWVTLEQERHRYAQHHNTRENAGYRRFLQEIVQITVAAVPEVKTILDFGCGEQAVLTQLLVENGFACEGYDPLYHPNALADRYDLVILCEVIEHLRDLRAELARIRSVLSPRGKVLLRTRLYPSTESLADWWYARDTTHINFFCPSALAEVASLVGRSHVLPLAKDVFILA